MVLPEDLGDCAQDGDQDRVFAWLDAGGDINDGDPQGCTLLCCCACGSYDDGEIGAPQMALARAILARGADVNRAHMRAPHREFLAVRGLAQRGKLAVQLAITARAARENPALNFIARLGDNGVCWHILTYWRGTD